MKKIILVTQLFVCAFFYAQGQPATGIENTPDLYQTALNQYEAGHYNLARQNLEKYISNNLGANLGDAHYYRAISAIKLLHQDGEYLLETFIKDFPFHSKTSTARYTIGDYYFENGKYDAAIKNFEQSTGSANIACDLNFKLGYSYLSTKKFENAKESFAKVTDQSCNHYLASNYYLGYLYYQDDDLRNALDALKIASADDGFGKSAALMIGNIYFRNNEYTEAISFIRSLSPESLSKNPELYFIRAGAHFQKGEFSEAVKYYEEGMKNNRNRASSDVFFNMAEAYRQINETDKAIEKYKFAALDDTEIGAYSSYYLGKLYIETDNKPFAKSAFQEALKSEKQIIREESLFQLAKVDFELGNYGESIRNFKKYDDEYPGGIYKNESKEFITKAFLSTSNYDIAISFIESSEEITENLKSIYQEVTFLKGADEFNNRKFSTSVDYFNKSLKYKKDNERIIAAHFWKAESFSIGKLYKDAIESYKSALYTTYQSESGKELHVKARYGLGYAYYNSKDYGNALANFKTYIRNIPDNADEREFYKENAQLRLADCYYVTKEYEDAIKNYQLLLSEGNSDKDYIYFQLGLVYSLLSEDAEAGNYFQKIINGYPNSKYLDNAMLQLAESSLEKGDYLVAIDGFSELISNYKKSPLIPYALVKRALAYSNLNQNKKSEKDYKNLLDNYTKHETANSALIGLQELSSKVEIPDFQDYFNKYQEANPDDESLENIEFESAKTLYFSQKYEQAINNFKNFQNKYQKSSLLGEADYYLGDSYYRSNQQEKAIPYLEKVAADNTSNYQNRTLDRLAGILVSKGEYKKGLSYFKILEEKSRNQRELGNAWKGIVSVFYQTKDYDQAEKYANKINEREDLSQDVKSKTALLMAKIHVEKGDTPSAEDLLIALVNGIKDENAAEANFELGQLYYNTERYKTSLQSLFELNRNFAQYSNWIGKSFLLISDNYVKLDELFQAKATLNSILENAEDEDLKKRASAKLIALEKLENEVLIEKDSVILIDTTSNTGNK